ncbi:hypothetical protein [Pseudohalioglobus lutimaris]|uniref:Uncharacterized protein n=1 Tax=Pseudohalioglobus lutimaris TaxID=1737061 RepID=A0A2N5WXF2_9GAMM|nr:hypothetical protein [Pseudohalioglobus lutimaris]PLW66908.1 hypothetical protein C0039_19430 [Pseudohalioglobus lutimaris]
MSEDQNQHGEDDQTEDLYPLTRERLYELAWSEPMLSIAKKYGVSSSFLARVCTRMNVPRPAPGYWTKVECGKAVTRPPLPEARPEDELQWDRHNDAPPRQRAELRAPAKKPRKIQRKQKRPATHKMIAGAKAHFLKTRNPRYGYLRPYKWILVDIIVSEKGLEQALNLANTLFWAFEDFGYRVTYSTPNEYTNRPRVDEREVPKKERDPYHDRHWSPSRATIVYVGDVAFGLTLIEISKNVEVRYRNGDWIPVSELKEPKTKTYGISTTIHEDRPAGKFVLQAYSAYAGTDWTMRWDLPSNRNVSNLGHRIAKELHAACPEILAQIERVKIEQEKRHAEYEEWKYKHEQERLEELWDKANSNSKHQLSQIISDWGVAKQIESFFLELERSASDLPPQKKALVSERVKAVLEYVGSPDAIAELLSWRSPRERMDALGESLPDSVSSPNKSA